MREGVGSAQERDDEDRPEVVDGRERQQERLGTLQAITSRIRVVGIRAQEASGGSHSLARHVDERRVLSEARCWQRAMGMRLRKKP